MNPIIPTRLKVIKNNNRYYTSIFNDKQSIYTFTNINSANNCAMFLSEFKHRYGKWPQITSEFAKKQEYYEKVQFDMISKEDRKPVIEIFGNELLILDEKLEDLQGNCILNNIGLLAITEFKTTVQDEQISMNMRAVSIMPEEFEYNTTLINKLQINNLNQLIYNIDDDEEPFSWDY